MSDVREILERGIRGATPPPGGFGRMLRRHEHRRRTKRITALVVGFCVAILLVASLVSALRLRASDVPANQTPAPPSPGPSGVPTDKYTVATRFADGRAFVFSIKPFHRQGACMGELQFDYSGEWHGGGIDCSPHIERYATTGNKALARGSSGPGFGFIWGLVPYRAARVYVDGATGTISGTVLPLPRAVQDRFHFKFFLIDYDGSLGGHLVIEDATGHKI